MAYDKYNEQKAYQQEVEEDTIALVEKTGAIIAGKKSRGEPIKPVKQYEIKPDLKEIALENEKTFDFGGIYKKFVLGHFRKKNTKENFKKMFEEFFEKPDNKEKLKNTYNIIAKDCEEIRKTHFEKPEHNHHEDKAEDNVENKKKYESELREILRYVIKHSTKCGKDFWRQVIERFQDEMNRAEFSSESSKDSERASLGKELTDLEFAFLETVKDLFVKNFKKSA